MANYVNSLLIEEGPSAFVIKVDLLADTTGELSNTVIVAGSSLTPALLTGQTMSIYAVWWQLSNFTIKFAWKNSSTTVPCWALAPGSSSHVDFAPFGGILDTSGSTSEQKLVISTNGFLTAASYGTFIMRMRKHDVVVPTYTSL